MLPMNLSNSIHQDINYLVMGLGLTGYSAASYLLSNGYSCKVIDSRDIAPYKVQLLDRFPTVEIHNGSADSALIDWADAFVVSPGISIRQRFLMEALSQGKKIIGDIELFAEAVTKPVIAITGSNGKSTVTTLVGQMIEAGGKKAAVGGNLGLPALDLLESDADIYVLELSSYQLETTHSLRPVVATILNLSEDHLDRYDDFEDYSNAKRKIFGHAENAVINHDEVIEPFDGNCVGFSVNPEIDVEFGIVESDGSYLARNNQPLLAVNELMVSGRHNWSNCLAAMALASSVGISNEAMITALKSFSGIPHRSQFVRKLNDVVFINDSKATNVGAARASIEGRSEPVILIAGGQSKGADVSILNETLRSRVKHTFLMGEDADILEAEWLSAVSITRVKNMRQAVKGSYELSLPGDCILLAPACASFDMYEKFEARGDDFMRCVLELEDVC